MDIKMAVDKIFASVGDEINYSITMSNQKEIPLKEVWLIDELPLSMKFVEGSIAVDGYPVDGVINKGILLGILLEGETKHITFKCVMSGLPEINPIINTADVYFREVVGEEKKQVPSTAVVIVVTDPNINAMAGTFEFFVNQEVISYQEVLSYTIRLTNQGNCRAEHINIKNLVPIQMAVKPESIRGTAPSVLDIQNNLIYIEGLDRGEQITLTYDVTTLPEIIQFEIPHQVTLEYEFVGPDRRRVYKQYVSQQVFSVICLVSFDERSGGFVKTANTSFCTVGDEILYTLKLINSGNVTATHLRLIDRTPQGIGFIPESLRVGGGTCGTGSSLEEGIILPDLKSNETIEIVYKGKVEEAALEEEKLRSQAYITYDYVVGEDFVTGEAYSNILETRLGIGLIDEDVFKLVSYQNVATLNDEVTYSMRLTNIGNISITPIHIIIDKPIGTSVIGEGWEEREGKAYLEYLLELKPNETVDMSYPLVIESLEALGDMQIECRLYYSYLIEDRLIERSLYRRQEGSIRVEAASLQREDGGIIKSVDQTHTTLDEGLTYTTSLTNTGNIIAQDVKLTRGLIGYTAVVDEEIIEVGDIAPYETRVITHALQVQTLPILGYIGSRDKVEYTYEVGDQKLKGFGESEEVITVVEQANLLGEDGQIRQSVDQIMVKPDDRLTYTLALTNRGNVSAEKIVLTLPELEEGRWLGEKIISLEKIEVGEICYLTYSLQVSTHIIGEHIVCNPQIDYVFHTSIGEEKQKSYKVAPIDTPIYRAKLTTSLGDMMGLIDKEYVTIGDEVTCKIQLFNEGNRTAKDVCILPEKVAGSEFGEQVGTPILELGDIKPREGIEASYKVRITDYQEELVLLSELRYTYNIEGGTSQEEVAIRETIRTAPITIKLAQLFLNKWTDKCDVSAKERIRYELTCKNEGNIEAVNVRLEECLPKGMHLCQETLSIEGEGEVSLLDKQTIGVVRIRQGETVKICFQVEVGEDSLKEEIIECTRLNYEMQIDPRMPLRPIYLRPIETKFHIVRPKVEVKLIGEEKIGLIGEALAYKIEITNKGNIAVQNVIVGIEMPEGMESISNALDNMSIPLLDRGEMSVIDFKVHITTKSVTGKAVLYPYVTYTYNTAGGIREKIEKVEATGLQIEEIKIDSHKKADKDFSRVRVGDEINYRIQIVNTGTMAINQLILYDELGTNTYLMEGSLRVNDVLLSVAHIGHGINLGEMSIGQTLVVDYKVRVEEYYSKFILSKSYLEYAVGRGESSHYIKGKTPIEIHKIRMITPNLATLCYRNTLTLPYQYLDIDKILDFKADALVIKQSKVSLHHLSIQGQISYTMVYISIDKIKQSIEWKKLFIEKVEGIAELGEEEIVLQAVVEKEYVGMINNRQIESRIEVGISEN